MNKTSLITIPFLITAFLLNIAIYNVDALTENLRVHVDLITTYSNGTLSSTAIDGALVQVTHIETQRTYKSYTENGWARFWLNLTGQYNLTIQYMNYIHIPKIFTISDVNAVTYLYDNIYKLAVFFAGDQLTIFHLIRVELPSAIVFKVPLYTNFTSYVDAYGGLKFELTKLENRIVFRPFDITRPFYSERGEIFYPNYTVTMEFKTLVPGTIGLIIGSNATNIIESDPLYSVPANVWIKIKYVVFAFEKPEIKELTKIETMLEKILSILLQIRDMLNKTVIPKLNEIYNYITLKLEKIDFNAIYEKLKEISYDIKMVRDTLNLFTSEFRQNIRNVLQENIGDFRILLYMFSGLAILSAVIVGFSRKKTQKEKPKYIVTK